MLELERQVPGFGVISQLSFVYPDDSTTLPINGDVSLQYALNVTRVSGLWLLDLTAELEESSNDEGKTRTATEEHDSTNARKTHNYPYRRHRLPTFTSDEYDTLSRGGAGLVSTTPNKRHISLGRFISHIRVDNQSDDIKERPFMHLLTIPADGAVEVVHDFSISRIFRHEQRLTKDDVVGESWKAYLNDGFIGATWWRWGDLEGDLKEKHLHIWHEGCRNRLPEPDVDDT
ncbi:hypothetical protein DIS24_g5133 [Lasiodiplodia hormozganensis]|uniref:Uncharacterized protein n=1 Tax=Lasiodiplodia hormozganensis TaxID=869390 RepID=A0AA39YLL2_9PEZI|nr:hypothetical protein DIS24_g5133 [Lasiodiplodia hormozganensis]